MRNLVAYHENMIQKHSKKNQEEIKESRCSQLGLSYTKTRELLLESLGNAAGPQSVPEIQGSFAQQDYFPNKTTLYREIEKLMQSGIVSKVQLAEERVSYEIAKDHHHHFVCQQCDAVTKLSFCEGILKDIETALAREGKRVERHTFEFFGVCRQCSSI